MKGQWCERNSAVFCQEDSGCDNCTVQSNKGFHARAEAHDLNHISTEPKKIIDLDNVSLSQIIEDVKAVLSGHSYLLYGGYAITVTYTKGE